MTCVRYVANMQTLLNKMNNNVGMTIDLWKKDRNKIISVYTSISFTPPPAYIIATDNAEDLHVHVCRLVM